MAETDPVVPIATRRIHVVAALAIAGLLAVPAVRAAAGQYWLNRAIAVIQQGHPKAFLALLDKSDAVAPGSFIDARMQRAGLYIDLLRTPNGIFSPAQQRVMSLYVLSTLAIAESEMPLWYDVNAKRAALYMEMKDRLAPDWKAQAEAQLRLAMQKNRLDADSAAALVDLEKGK